MFHTQRQLTCLTYFCPGKNKLQGQDPLVQRQKRGKLKGHWVLGGSGAVCSGGPEMAIVEEKLDSGGPESEIVEVQKVR